MGRSVPSAAISTVLFAKPTTVPRRRTRATGLSTPSLVYSLTMRKISSQRRPRASAAAQPVKRSATGFKKTIRPCESVAITTSPMLSSVRLSHSRCAAISATARFSLRDVACDLNLAAHPGQRGRTFRTSGRHFANAHHCADQTEHRGHLDRI
jgi:hypothetical protein